MVEAWPSGELVAFSCSGSPLCRHLCSSLYDFENFQSIFACCVETLSSGEIVALSCSISPLCRHSCSHFSKVFFPLAYSLEIRRKHFQSVGGLFCLGTWVCSFLFLFLPLSYVTFVQVFWRHINLFPKRKVALFLRKRPLFWPYFCRNR